MIELIGKRILIVEDEPIIAMCLDEILCHLGCVVVGSAARLTEGTAMAAAGVIDAAILDINLGGEHSYPIAAILAGRMIPYLYATGYGHCGHPAALDAPLIEKPYTSRQIANALSGLLAS